MEQFPTDYVVSVVYIILVWGFFCPPSLFQIWPIRQKDFTGLSVQTMATAYLAGGGGGERQKGIPRELLA